MVVHTYNPTHVGLRLVAIFLLQLPKYWNPKPVPPHLVPAFVLPMNPMRWMADISLDISDKQIQQSLGPDRRRCQLGTLSREDNNLKRKNQC